ncbi:MAG: chemotaxis protein CheX [Phycisphaeraceae bacterium]|nr:chemotaxis protein CheX [Phycisphaerales bacterium]MCB9860337.1 chemotaxis protein CheX [Phycisphaeraceae bacterium]
MDPRYITPFIKSIQNVFSTMLQLEVSINEPSVNQSGKTPFDVSGIIGISGDVKGTIVLSFPNDTAQRVVALFTGEELTSESPDFADAIGELVNMVSGGAKAMFDTKRASISTPSVILGGGHIVVSPRSDVPCISIPCTTDCGDLTIEIAFEVAGSEAEKNEAANAA